MDTTLRGLIRTVRAAAFRAGIQEGNPGHSAHLEYHRAVARLIDYLDSRGL